MIRPVHYSVLLAILLSLAGATPAGAALLTGNLLVNPGAESGTTGWTVYTTDTNGRTVAVGYGTPDFPTSAQGAAIGGGRNLFAGGPSPPNDDGGSDSSHSILFQEPQVPAGLQAAVNGGHVNVAVSGCLGGYSSQNDKVTIFLIFLDQTSFIGSAVLKGPDAAGRGKQTTLLPRLTDAAVPPGTVKLVANVNFDREPNAKDRYNDAYADNLSLSLHDAGSAPPPAGCPAPGSGGGGGEGGGQTPGGGAGSVVARIGRSARFRKGRIVLRLRCVKKDERCAGRVALSTASLPKPASTAAVALGKARFSIAPGKTKKVSVRPRRAARRRLAHLSRRQLRRVRIRVKATVGHHADRFKLRLRR
jgi:hypothetical protein